MGSSSSMGSSPRAPWLVVVAAVAAAAGVVGGDFAADQKECADQLVGLATCLTYVQEQASAAAPTPDCCAGLKAVLQTSRKCLCVLIKDRDEPSLGFKINVTKALGLPAICHAAANISDCPRLLNLPPNSKEAQIFEQYGKQQAALGPSPGATGGSSGAASTGAQKNAAGPARGTARWLGVGGVGAGGARAAAALSFLFSAAAAAPLAVLPFLLVLG